MESKPSDLEVFDFKRHNPNLKVWIPRLNLMALRQRVGTRKIDDLIQHEEELDSQFESHCVSGSLPSY
ncbi:MAG: hypothetical protein KAI83_10785 [Thiomargarita sp.]|nr:hypothetical protein [Thiomargarita sp.]